MSGERRRGLGRGLALCGLLLLAGGLIWGIIATTSRVDERAEAYGAAIGGPFRLTDSQGRAFGSDELRGRPYAIFFGFTRCPDVCPTTLSRMAALRRQLGSDGDRFAIVFVSVDPESDTPQSVGQYLTLFGTPIIGLTGRAQQLDPVKRAFGIYAQRVPLQGGGYTMDHTATVFLMGSRGQFVSTLDVHEDDGNALAKLRRLIET